LEGPDQAQLTYLVRFQTQNRLSPEKDPPQIRAKETGQDIEQSGLPRPVRSDNGHDFPGMDLQRNTIQGAESAEILLKVFYN
jgi:hypothetical protein